MSSRGLLVFDALDPVDGKDFALKRSRTFLGFQLDAIDMATTKTTPFEVNVLPAKKDPLVGENGQMLPWGIMGASVKRSSI